MDAKKEAVFSPIPGSSYLRAYCSECNEPMRVSLTGAKDIAAGVKPVCSGCQLHAPPERPDPTAHGDRQYHGSRFYAGEY